MNPGSAEDPRPYLGVGCWPAIASPVAPDPGIERRIAELLGRMTLEEKVGQIIQAEIQHTTPEDVRSFHLGSVFNGGGSLPNRDKHASPADWLAMADAYYDASMDTSDGGVAIPILWGSDAVHGHNNVIGATIFPHNIGLGAMHDPALVREIGRVTALEVRATGIDWTFAPTVAVPRDLRWGRSYESYGQDPALVAAYAAEMVRGLQGDPGTTAFLDVDHVVATAKHFLGDGATEGGDDQGDATIDEAELRDVHAQGYFAAIEAGAQVVMASFSSWQGQKMHGHRYLLTDVLKGRIGLDGMVVGDWNGHGQLPGCTNASSPEAINAGLDMFMVVEDWKALFRNTLHQAETGVIPRYRLDDAVRRILRVKFRAGLFSKGRPSQRGVAGRGDLLGCSAHRTVAREAVRKSLVLLKNDNRLLPLAPSANVLVAGDGAHSMGKQTGGWTITWQGTDNGNGDFPGATTIYDGIAQAVTRHGGQVAFSADGTYQSKPDVAIVVFGEEPYAEFQGDLDTLEFEPVSKRSLALLKRLKADGIAVVSIFLSGRPLWVNPEINASDAFVAAWLPGSEGAGIADVIFADAEGREVFDFTGRLSFGWPALPLPETRGRARASGDLLFPLGYGLSYRGRETGPGRLEEAVPGVGRAGNSEIVLYRGRPLAPWAVFAEGATGEPSIMSGPYVRHVTGQVEIQTTDMAVQEDALKILFRGGGRASIYLSGSKLSFEPFHDRGLLQFRIKIDEPLPGELWLGVGAVSVALNPMLEDLVGRGWQSISVPLKRFADRAQALRDLERPFCLSSSTAMQVCVSEIRVLSGDRPGDESDDEHGASVRRS